jgi:hypothetical protein
VSSFGRHQGVDSLRAPGQVNHSVGAARFRNADLLDTLADGGNRLEIVGLVASLNFVELITRIMPRVLWEVSQVLERITKETR